MDRANERGDSLFTSYLALGEVLAGAEKSRDSTKSMAVRATLDAIGFSSLPFGEQAVKSLGRLRSETRLKFADSINLACAASAGIDLFLTGDRQLVGRYVPGIQFIVDFRVEVL